MAYEFECSHVVPGCEDIVTGETKEDTVEAVARHAREAHGMAELPEELTGEVLVSIQPTN